ncbi:hypothetical protein JTB14_017600 [Gonioctena quinquepunctata]|nr:hypothetical protein JTB14_017600 [Gonioctena quinquepunctata]
MDENDNESLKENENENDNESSRENVEEENGTEEEKIHLVQPIVGSNRNITADNWFSPAELTDELKECGFTYTETTALEYDENNTENIAISEDLNEMPSTSTSSTSADQVVCCIFCNQKQKKSGKRVLNLIISWSNELCERIKNVAESLDDQELETELTYTSVQDSKVPPPGLSTRNNCSTHVAFDNFDRFVDTNSGKNTMNDTVGIVYRFCNTQNGDSELEPMRASTPELHDNEEDHEPPRQRRRFVGISQILELRTSKRFAIQKKKYLSPINSPPTPYAVVNETLIMANEIAEECYQDQIIVTYDLAIAEMAMQIQEKEHLKFDNLDAFHMQIAFFKAIGKFIDSCGLVGILVHAEVLADGSTNSFLDILEQARAANVKFNAEKIQYRVQQVRYLGNRFDKYGMRSDSNEVKAITELEETGNKKEFQ